MPYIGNKSTAERMSRVQFQWRADSPPRSLERCKFKGKFSNVVDIDSERDPDLIIIDEPEPSERTSPDASVSRHEKTPVCPNIICIDDDDDDDDDDDESFYYGGSMNDLENGEYPNFDTSSDSSCDQGRKLSSKTLDCEATCSSKRFSFSTSDENDDSDCDIVEDYAGNIRQQWEEASLRKKRYDNIPKRQFEFRNEVGFGVDSDIDVDKTAEAPEPCSTGGNHENCNRNKSKCIDEDVTVNSNKLEEENRHTDLEMSIQQEIYEKPFGCSTKVIDETNSKNTGLLASNIDDLSNIIGNREMLKKTDAYKCAEEEEWLSRQRELKLQAEEARRLRKRKKAETLRLLETERRQKQRVEEVREAQRKDEETLNLKEQLRSEIRNKLDKLEAESRDMAQLLHGLGIEIKGGLFPLPTEVRAAYKQALLRFHPDRASRSDLRQQIEAEEKFKLISRAKEKFML